jgi:hypothetical protein
MDRYDAEIEVTTTGEYAEHGEVKVVMYDEQATALVNLLSRPSIRAALDTDENVGPDEFAALISLLDALKGRRTA